MRPTETMINGLLIADPHVRHQYAISIHRLVQYTHLFNECDMRPCAQAPSNRFLF